MGGMGAGTPVADGSVRIGMNLAGVNRGLVTLRGKLTAFASMTGRTLSAVIMAPSNISARLSEAAAKIAFAMVGISTLFALVGKKAIQVASDFQESMNKFKVVFRDQADEMAEWAFQFADATNRSRSGIISMMATVQDFLVPMGLAREKASEMAKAVVSLTTDLSSFANLDTEEAFTKIISALAGETEAVRRLGIDISDLAVNQYLLNEGFERGSAGASFLVKTIARLNIMFKNSSDALGDAIRTAGDWANALRGLWSQVENLQLALGTHLIPLLEPYLAKMVKIVKAATEWVRQNPLFVTGLFKLSKGIAAVAAVAGVAAGGLAALAMAATPLGALAGYLGSVAVQLGIVDFGISELSESLGSFAVPLMDLGGAIFAKLKVALSKLGSYLLATLADVMGRATGWLGTIWTKVKGLIKDWEVFGKSALQAVIIGGIALALRGFMAIVSVLEQTMITISTEAEVAIANLLRKVPVAGKLVPSEQSIRLAGALKGAFLSDITREGTNFVAGFLEDIALDQARIAGGQINRPGGADGITGILQNLSNELAASAAAMDPQANADLLAAIGQFQGIAADLIQGMPDPAAVMQKIPLDWGRGAGGKDKGPKDTFGIWGFQSLGEMMGFQARDPQKEQVSEQKKSNALLKQILSVARAGGGQQAARYAP